MSGYIHEKDALLTRYDVKKELQKVLRSRTEELRLASGDHGTQLARKLGIDPDTVHRWFKVGRVSPWGALEVERHFKKLKAAYLRPDVLDWEDIKAPGKHRGRF